MLFGRPHVVLSAAGWVGSTTEPRGARSDKWSRPNEYPNRDQPRWGAVVPVSLVVPGGRPAPTGRGPPAALPNFPRGESEHSNLSALRHSPGSRSTTTTPFSRVDVLIVTTGAAASKVSGRFRPRARGERATCPRVVRRRAGGSVPRASRLREKRDVRMPDNADRLPPRAEVRSCARTGDPGRTVRKGGAARMEAPGRGTGRQRRVIEEQG